MLEKPELSRIVDLEISKVLGRLVKKRIILTLDDSAREFLIKEGYDPQYGARPMRRAVERFLEDPLAEEILKGSLHDGEPVNVTVEDNKLVFNQNTPASGALSTD